MTKLAPGRWYRNGNGFSTGHYSLGSGYPMIDIDKLKLSAELTISRENSVFVEYDYRVEPVRFIALFSLKHSQSRFSTGSRSAFDFLKNISNKVLREMARQLGARLFVVFHGDREEPPFEIHEVDIQSGTVIKRAEITGQTQECWTKAWTELGLQR